MTVCIGLELYSNCVLHGACTTDVPIAVSRRAFPCVLPRALSTSHPVPRPTAEVTNELRGD